MSIFNRSKMFIVIVCTFSFLFVTSCSGEKAQQRRNEKLVEAVGEGNISQVKTLIKQGADINTTYTQYGDVRTVLMYASNNGYLEVVKYLVESGADINIMSEKGYTALMIASDVEIVKYLVENDADINLQTEYGRTALSFAEYFTGDKDIVEYLTKQGVSMGINNQLLKATSEENISQVKTFIEQGADINVQSADGESALVIASGSGHIEIVQYLVENGKDVNLQNDDSSTALIVASEYGHIEVVKYLIKKGGDINFKNGHATALMSASRKGHLEIVKYLLENGAYIHANSPMSGTALMQASYEGHLEIVKYLIENGADANLPDSNEYDGGSTALMKASGQGHIEVVKYLVENGADIDQYPKALGDGTAFSRALRYGHIEVIEYLVNNGVDINAEVIAGDTALTWASSEGHIEVVKCLVENGADINTKNGYEDTALERASYKGHKYIVEYLETSNHFNKQLLSEKLVEAASAGTISQEIGKTYRTTDNLRLREKEGTAGTPLFTLPMDASVKILAQGNEETIDGITANWVQVEVVEDTESTQGETIEKGAVGWCFGGYLGEY